VEGHAVKLLLVEDNEAAAASLQRLLSKSRFLSFGVTRDEYLNSALIRLRHPKDGQFDVILLDLNLPDSIGVDTVATVYREVPEVPIVVLSGQEDIKIADMALQCGAMDFVVKKSPPEYNERDIVDELERKVWTSITNHRKSLTAQRLTRISLEKAGAPAASPAIVQALVGNIEVLDEGIADLRSYLKLHYPDAWDALERIYNEKLINPLRNMQLQLSLERKAAKQTKAAPPRTPIETVLELTTDKEWSVSATTEDAERSLLEALELDILEGAGEP
jgi:FixJ family two-component response regulator